jgi:GNAT superfamily N-acetyltransferase
MTHADVDEVASFHRRTVVVAYAGIFPPDAPVPTVEELAADWQVDHRRAWVAVDDGVVVGTVAVSDGDLRRLLVDTSRWGEGIGRRLHDVAVRALAQAGRRVARLWVLEDNDRARAFYERLGWTQEPGELLVHRSGVREVRYRLPTRLVTAGAGSRRWR